MTAPPNHACSECPTQLLPRGWRERAGSDAAVIDVRGSTAGSRPTSGSLGLFRAGPRGKCAGETGADNRYTPQFGLREAGWPSDKQASPPREVSIAPDVDDRLPTRATREAFRGVVSRSPSPPTPAADRGELHL